MFQQINLAEPKTLCFLWKGSEKFGFIGVLLMLMFFLGEVKAQVQVFTEQGVQFGEFVAGSTGGTLTVNFEEERWATGNIILINQDEPFQPAVFGIEAPYGTMVNLINGPDVVLEGSNGGQMTVSLGPSSRGSSFISDAVPPDRNYVSFSTTLTVGPGLENPPGKYSGNLSITVFQD